MKPLSFALALGSVSALAVIFIQLNHGAAATAGTAADSSLGHPLEAGLSPAVWREEKRAIDLHLHVEARPERFERAVRILDAAGVGIGTILGSGTVTPGPDGVSQFERSKTLADAHPGRFIHFMLLDFSGWDEPEWGARAAEQIASGHRLGATGLKEFKRLGLFLKDGAGKLIRVDDPKLDPVWKKCGELGMPVSIHVADPKAFWEPYNGDNERWAELEDHPDWWFGNSEKYPDRMELLESLDRVVARHPETTFVCVHFANNAEDLQWVDAALDRNPNMMADIAARIPEIGRHPPDLVRKLFIKHQDRILLGTDFMVYSKLILGSGGDEEVPTDGDALTFYQKTWKWFETADKNWQHMTPIQGGWTISSIDLPPEVLRKIYFDNARKLLCRALPLPVIHATRISRDFVPDGCLNEPEWAQSRPVRLEYRSADSHPVPNLGTPVRVLWSDQFLYLSFECPFVNLSTFDTPHSGERIGLWENDVVELFACSDPSRPLQYTEYQWAPNGESLDLKLALPERDFEWDSGMQSAVRVDDVAKVWRAEIRIPLKALSEVMPGAGSRWRVNLFRHDRQHRAGLAFSPTLEPSFHLPVRFGWLVFDP